MSVSLEWNNSLCLYYTTINSLVPERCGYNGIILMSNHRRPDCLLNRLFRRRSKKTSKLCATGLCEGNPPVIVGFPSQRTCNVKNVSI